MTTDSQSKHLYVQNGINPVERCEAEFTQEVAAESKQNGASGLFGLITALEQVQVSYLEDDRPSGFSKLLGSGRNSGDVILCPSEHVILTGEGYGALCIIIRERVVPFLLTKREKRLSFIELSERAQEKRDSLKEFI